MNHVRTTTYRYERTMTFDPNHKYVQKNSKQIKDL